jgi:sodium-dependent phosphate cotransporter
MEKPLKLDISISESQRIHNVSEERDATLTIPEVISPRVVKRAWWERVRLGKLVLFVFSLYLFILAITFMKEGARGIAPLLHNMLDVSNIPNSLGFGWLFAYLIMSGSPVAAAALAFFDAGAVDQLGAFAMITGSRLGASFIVLFIGFLYVLRGRDRATSLSMGLLTLTVTATTYLPGLFIGAFILNTGLMDHYQLHSGTLLQSVTDLIIEPIITLAVNLVPSWGLFILGLALIMLSFNLFDKCLPQMTIKESQVGWMSRLVYRPWVMFVLGALVTLISMSVSISLSILVPLSARGFVRRENVVPYIMGANITTFIDTLLAAVLLDNPPAFTVVFVEMISITLISVLILVFVFRWYQRLALKVVTWITTKPQHLLIFMLVIFLVPALLLII